MNKADNAWRALQQRSLEEAQQEQWGLYCNTLFEMAQFLDSEGRKRHALEAFMTGVYISLNGPNNLPYPPLDRELLKEIGVRRWEPEFGLPITTHVFRISELAEELGLGIDAIKELFAKVVEARRQAMKTPMDFDTAWEHVSETFPDVDDELDLAE